MSLLFNIENKVVKPTIEVLLLSPFKEIWNRDTSNGKFQATDEFTYIEFMTSVKKTNPYRGYTEEERKMRLSKVIMKQDNYEPDALVLEGMEALIEFQKSASPTFNYFASATKAAYKVQTFFENFDLNQLNERTGLPVYKPKDITSALNDTERVLQSLLALEEKVSNELFENTKIKGQKVVSVFADPSTM